MTVAIFLIVLFFALAIGTPIAFALLLSAISLLFYIDNVNSTIIAQNLIYGAQNFPLLAIPFFILAGELMNNGGIAKRLVNFALSIFGHIRGGLGYVVIFSSIIFAGLSGSAVADAAALAAILLPMMVQGGYVKNNSMGLIASGSIIALLIPPSITLIMYGVIAGVSITKLFMAGIVPGILMALGISFTWFLIVRKKDLATLPKKSLKEVFKAFREAGWALALPLIIIIGLRGGIFTPTEAAAVAVFYALFVGLFIYRELDFRKINQLLINAAKTTSIVVFMIAAAMAGAWAISIANIPEQLSEILGPLSETPLLLLFIVMLLTLLLGMVMDTGPIMLILVPIVLPLMTEVGIDPVYLGILFVLNGAIGLITPPVGSVLNVSVGLSKLSITEITKGIWPFIITYIIILALIVIFPGIITIPLEWMM